jgi:hypothetical protein
VNQVPNIVSGGQTGADRAALDFAIEHGIQHGGWCPKGRRAEDGTIDARYQLKERPGTEYDQRTEWNARDSDGTRLGAGQNSSILIFRSFFVAEVYVIDIYFPP